MGFSVDFFILNVLFEKANFVVSNLNLHIIFTVSCLTPVPHEMSSEDGATMFMKTELNALRHD